MSGKQGSRRGGRFPEGRFDSFYLQDVGQWIYVPPQEYTYEVWDPEANDGDGAVVEKTLPFYAYVEHSLKVDFKRNFKCSAGPHLSEPCWGHAYNKIYNDELRAIEDQTGVKPKFDPEVRSSRQYAVSIVQMEPIYQVKKRDSGGKIAKNQNGQTIFRSVPESLMDPEDLEDYRSDNKGVTFGRKAHWSMSKPILEQLFDLDERLGQYCACCAVLMMIPNVVCPDCGNVVDLDSPVSGNDELEEFQNRKFKCTDCQYVGTFVPRYVCPDCSGTEGGSLFHFDIQIKKKKVGDKANELRLLKVRVHDTSRKEVNAMVDNPFNLPQVLAGDDIEYQKNRLNNELREKIGSPDRGIRKADERDEEDEDAGVLDIDED